MSTAAPPLRRPQTQGLTKTDCIRKVVESRGGIRRFTPCGNLTPTDVKAECDKLGREDVQLQYIYNIMSVLRHEADEQEALEARAKSKTTATEEKMHATHEQNSTTATVEKPEVKEKKQAEPEAQLPEAAPEGEIFSNPKLLADVTRQLSTLARHVGGWSTLSAYYEFAETFDEAYQATVKLS